MTDYPALLREATVECHSGLEHDYGTCAAGCKDGQVPLVPGLTRPCPRCMGRKLIRLGKKCPECHGSGKVLVSPTEAQVALEDYCYEHGLEVRIMPQGTGTIHYNIFAYPDAEHWGGNTLAHALCKALGLVK